MSSTRRMRQGPAGWLTLKARLLGLMSAGLTTLFASSTVVVGMDASPLKARGGVKSVIMPVAVFGKDDRVLLTPQRHKLSRSIGLLHEVRAQTICTAFCVDDATIATAGHCLFRTEGETAPRLSGFTFRLPGVASGVAGSAHGGGGQFVAASALTLKTRPPIDAVHDWALVRLASPICAGHTLRVSRRSPDELVSLSAQDRVYQVAYHRDFGNWQLALGAPCAIRREFATADRATIGRDFADADRVILHTCDTGGASSGSPLLIDGSNGPEVIGINVGTYVQSRILTHNGEVVHRFKSDSVANTGVTANAFVDRLEAFKRADILESRGKVRELQALLASEGYYLGRRDGLYGADLMQAIEGFERAEGRPETGLATTVLLTRLKARQAGREGRQQAEIETGNASSRLGHHEVLRATAPAKRSVQSR